ncbi:uncharacterized protein LOC144348115 [Saccoglossus kowalevskii]
MAGSNNEQSFSHDGLTFQKHVVQNAYPKNLQADRNVKWIVTDNDGVIKECLLKSRRSSINDNNSTAVYLSRKIGVLGVMRADLVNDDDTFVNLEDIARMEGEYYLAVDKDKSVVKALWLGKPPK